MQNYSLFLYWLFQVDTLTVPQLKTYLQNAGIKVTGLNKAALVTKVYEHVGID